jgi:hypothetical protein
MTGGCPDAAGVAQEEDRDQHDPGREDEDGDRVVGHGEQQEDGEQVGDDGRDLRQHPGVAQQGRGGEREHAGPADGEHEHESVADRGQRPRRRRVLDRRVAEVDPEGGGADGGGASEQ